MAERNDEPEESRMVRVLDYIPDIQVDLKYAGEDNFTGKVIYGFQDAYLRYGTVKKLKIAQEKLKVNGLGLKIWDGFRPVFAQFRFWELCPDDTYVADPRKGYSNHSRGNAVDVTLVDSQGNELEMPTAFDDFEAVPNRDYSMRTEAAAGNARLLERTMESCGFLGYEGEWWHFNDTVRYPVEAQWVPQNRKSR